MRSLRHTLAALLLAAVSSTAAANITIVHPEPRAGSALDLYAIDLIEFLAEKSGESVTLQAFQGQIGSQSRKVEMLKQGRLTVDWLGADRTLESELLPIRYPVFRGLLGHRLFITNQATEPKLAQISDQAGLNNLTMIQGQGWADVKVLQSAGFRVREISSFENIFKAVDTGRADLFPRALIEPFSELAERPQYANLLVDPHLMLIYRFPMFLFVSPQNPEVATMLNDAFAAAYQDGSFIEFFENAPLVKETFEKANIGERTFIRVDNPHLSNETQAIDDKFWLDIESR
ncbi:MULTISPECIES: hypothetical protein [Salinivibrio]|uniref:hypothetical protein n=1 Tax=Salinivibrio TaxID=51366 RepID=UPI000985CBF9|nr:MULTISPECIES: hypothetical protein [Salinivibrio]OOF14395.1 hypothetical protein BZG83_05965 [Salinivibrio sp. PR919]OOF17360.1 hypothetical protein BZG84_07435 [Salinivibrio sp. PR932]OOF31080.1 hypothetical protein BZJ20_08205 [Salinivibrio proteolyticus]